MGIRSSRPRAGGGREGKAIATALQVHNNLTLGFIADGFTKELSSKMALETMKANEIKTYTSRTLGRKVTIPEN